MPSPNHHIILRQVFDLEFPAGADGFAMQQEVGRIVRENLLPRMEALFDRFAASDELIRIDRLELDIGRIPPSELEETLVRTVLKQLEEQLEIAVINQPSDVQRLPVAESHFDQWLFFLEYGFRPQQAADVPEAALQTAVLEKLASESAAVERFRRLLYSHPTSLLRLIRQYAEPFLVHVLETLTARSQSSLPDYLQEMLKWSNAFRESRKQTNVSANMPAIAGLSRITPIFWQIIFEQVLNKSGFAWTTENLFAAFLKHFAASGNPQQESLVLFWQDMVRFKESPYPLTKAILEQTPELLKSGEQRIESLNTMPEGRSGPDDEKIKAREDEFAGLKTSESFDVPPSSLAGKPDAGAGQSKQPVPEAGTYYEPDRLEGKEVKSQPETPFASQPDNQPESPEIRAGSPVPDAEANEPAQTGDTTSTEPGTTSSQAGQTQESSDQTIGEGQPTLPPKPVQTTVESPSKTVQTGDFWYIANAGVVLLHPFLSPYFKTAGLLEQGKFIDEAAQHKAVHLVHFLATGQTGAPEYGLVLPRFLCGLPFDVPMERFVDISTDEQAEGEKLLKAAIDHWNKLGSTSPDGLREGFLRRDGKLEKREAGWCLSVEQKTIDILLDFLPWTLSMIKLPWMPELLRVEWA